MNTVIKIIRFILILVLTISIISLVFINVANSTILNKDYVLEKLEETNYYINIKGEIDSAFQNYIGQSGLDEEVLQNIVTEDKIKEDTNIILSNIYDGTSKEISTDEIEQNLRKNIENSLDTKLNVTQQRMVDEYVTKICNQYLDTMSHTKYENNIYNVISKINTYTQTGQKILMIAIVIMGLIIIISNYKKIAKAIAHLGISIMSSSIFMIIVNIYINTKIKIANIVILNEAISVVVRNVMNNILDTVKTQGIIFLIIGLLMIIVGNTIVSLKDKNNKNVEDYLKK